MNFKLTHIPNRDEKPRDKGVTMMMDKGMSLREAENFIEGSGHLTDLVKFGFGTSYVTPNLKEKIKLYKESGIKPYFGGTLFEAFYVRNKVKDFEKLVNDMGMETVEISDGSVVIPHDEKCEIINKFSKNYTVLSEVGSKEAGIIISPAKWIKMMTTELEAGSWKVIAEGRESGSVGIFRPNGKPHTMLVNKIISKVKPEDILWEAPVKNQQVWFINLFGANVNLGNIAPYDMIPLECLRLGLRGDTFFNYLPENIVATKKQSQD
ncbi:MAG: phosphosulfolactate synthase [Flavobacteriales bacterium]|nr:phosphosulfolactate synthase [Flavobacteriales bacterium]MCB9197201.1 phosphosulfolactate synthase [Flavobacteriales bacterium]